MKRSPFLKKIDRFSVITFAIISGAFLLLRAPSLIEPYWYGDEGIYQVIGAALRNGRILYSQIWDNKPPLLYLIYALFYGQLFYVKLLSIIVGVVSVGIFFLFSRDLFSSKKSVLIATSMFAVFFGSPILEGNIANAENFMLLPTLLGFYFFLNGKGKTKYILPGIFLSVSFLIKTVAVFDLAAILFILTILEIKKNQFAVKAIIKKNSITLCAFLILPVMVAGYFLLKGAFLGMFAAIVVDNIGYVGVENAFLFPMDLLVLKIVLLGIGLLIIFRFSKKLSKIQIIIYSWLLFSLFSIFFSQRPYTHYVLLLLPSISLLVGYIFEQKKRIAFLHGAVAFFIIFSINLTIPHYEKNIQYYKNYVDFVSGKKNFESYVTFFDKYSVRDYDIAQFLSFIADADDRIFIWSDSAQIYSLIGRIPPGKYIVAYHALFFDNEFAQSKKDFIAFDPTIIIQTTDIPPEFDIVSSYRLSYKVLGANIYEKL